jgi:hypothetical protein
MGRPPTIPSSFDEVGDYKQHVSLKHQSYIEHQDGDTHDDVINQCTFATHTTSCVYEHDNTIIFDACETEILDALHHHKILYLELWLNVNQIFNGLRPLFGWISAHTIQNMFNILPSMHDFLWVLF